MEVICRMTNFNGGMQNENALVGAGFSKFAEGVQDTRLVVLKLKVACGIERRKSHVTDLLWRKFYYSNQPGLR